MNRDIMRLLDMGMCPTCGQEVGEYRDELSKREACISGMCQKCQDDVFSPDCDQSLPCGCCAYCGCICDVPPGPFTGCSA